MENLMKSIEKDLNKALKISDINTALSLFGKHSYKAESEFEGIGKRIAMNIGSKLEEDHLLRKSGIIPTKNK